MKNQFQYKIFYFFIFLAIVYSCARVSSPTGGPKDEEAPEILGYSIENESNNIPVNTQKINIEFNEFIKLKDATNQIIISPPMEISPTFSPLGSAKKVLSIQFNESLKENTTYSINFGESIEDNNEGNKLSNFVYVFSTGETLDSLTYSGKIHNVKSLDFDDKAFVGLYKIDTAFNDSTIFKQKPYYVTRPDSLGNFKFNYLHEGSYFVMGLSDGNRNLKYDPIIDKLAFKCDTVSIPSEEKPHLKLFTEREKFAIKAPTFKDWGKIIFEFLGNPDSIRIQNRDEAYTEALQIPSKTKDSLTYWFKPLAKDTLKESKKDTLSFFVFHKNQPIDTLTFKKKVQFRPKKVKLELKKSENDFGSLQFTSETPITKLDKKLITILKDSTTIDFEIIQKTNEFHQFALEFKKNFESSYKINFLPNAVHDFFGETTDSLSFSIKTLKEQDYANLEVVIENQPKSYFWLQLMQNKKVKREQYVRDSIVTFKHIKPGTYTLQMIIDQNNNGSWDTGDFLKKTQPEPYLFNTEEILLNAYWDVKKTWDITQEPVLKKKLDKKAKKPTKKQ